MRLGELAPRERVKHVRLALDGVLRQADAPMRSSEVIHRVARLLGAERDEQSLIARIVTGIASEHPLAQQTDETFVRYGRTMRRWEWLPDMWTIHPGGDTA